MSQTTSVGSAIAEAVVRVLILDDDPDWYESTKMLLETFGDITVDVSSSREQADALIQDKQFDVVIVDAFLSEFIGFVEEESERGDAWLWSRVSSIQPSLAAVITAYPRSAYDQDRLQSRNIDLLVKSTDSEFAFYTRIERMVGELQSSRSERIGSDQSSQRTADTAPVEVPEAQAVAEQDILEREIRRLFREWADSLASVSEARLWFGEQDLTVGSLLQEVEKDSEHGREFLRLFVRHLRAKLLGRRPV